jgi:hypothetical protein
MYESELRDLRSFEGEALKSLMSSPSQTSLFANYERSYLIGVEFLHTLANEIENRSRVNPISFKKPLFKAFYDLQLNGESLKTFVNIFFQALPQFLAEKGKINSEFSGVINTYREAVLSSIDENKYINNYSYSLSGIEEFKTSTKNVRITPLSKNEKTRTVQTLFPCSRYWYPPKQRPDEVYSPLQFNKSKTSYKPISANPGVFTTVSDETVVYEGKVYTKKPGVVTANNRFVEEDWDVYVPKNFNPSKSFSKVYSELLKGVYTDLSENAQVINSITSDSKVQYFSPDIDQNLLDKDLLIHSFGGAGKKIYDHLVELRILSGYMGGYEGSPAGSVSYLSTVVEYLDLISTGRVSKNLEEEGFGNFNSIFPTSSDSFGKEGINGLRFLEKFSPLKSFLHNQTIPEDVDIYRKTISINPLKLEFDIELPQLQGISIYDRRDEDLDFIKDSLNVLMLRSKIFGDKLDQISKGLDRYGHLSGYNSLGSISFQVAEFQKIFPPRSYLNQTTTPGGFTGAILSLSKAYGTLSDSLQPLSLPPSLFSEVVDWLRLLLKSLEAIRHEFISLGIKTKGVGYLPNIETKKFISSSKDTAQYLSLLGFTDSEINQIFKISSFSELIEKLAPLSDSKDLHSFFRGYELSQLIYEFGGDKGVEAYLNFLYKKSPISGLLNVLSITEISKSDQTSTRISKYPRLIALLMGLSYAIDPDQLNQFSYILGDNKVDLLESISLLLKNNQDTIIKKQENVDVLSAVVEQLIRGYYPSDLDLSPDVSYEWVKEKSPIDLKKWTKVIDSSLGNVENPDRLKYLYDKAIGLTLKELLVLLNNPSPTSGIGQIMDGFYGGDFTKFLKYANISGLAIKLGYYKNSTQLNNSRTDFDLTYNTIPSALESLETIIQSTALTIKLIEMSINEDWYNTSYKKPQSLDSVLNYQNKPVQAMLNLFTDSSPLTLKKTVETIPPQDPPGIGNSRLPNRVGVFNSLTPEQARILSSSPTLPPVEYSTEFSSAGVINKFIKVTERNLILNNFSLSQEASLLYNNKSPGIVGSGSQRKETLAAPSESDMALYKELKSQEVSSSGTGRNYLNDPGKEDEDKINSRIPSHLLSSFDPVASCKRFGGKNCEDLYKDSQRCSGMLNKSSLPETYHLVPFNEGIVVDRPLGYFAHYLPSDQKIISNKLPSYYSLLDSPAPGPDSEPYLPSLNRDPIVFSSEQESGDLVDYANTRMAISEFLRMSGKEHTELTCASILHPHLYQICMNSLKCKRFRPSNESRLKFCPAQTSGGRKGVDL